MCLLDHALLFLVNVRKEKYSVGVGVCRPNINITIDAPGYEIFILKLWSDAQRNNLDDLLIVSLWVDMALAPLIKAHHEEGAVTER